MSDKELPTGFEEELKKKAKAGLDEHVKTKEMKAEEFYKKHLVLGNIDLSDDSPLTHAGVIHIMNVFKDQQIKELKAFKDRIEKTVHPRHWKEQR